MIIAIPRHVAQSADLSARARIPALSQLLVAAALALARLEDRLEAGTRSVDLSDHLAKDIGIDRLPTISERPVVSGLFPHL
ncbi:hypothetical protein A9Q96_08755 [Rhodobacterales bacterium 52_120_T64]|nr:hypothetical protein A9Q96_08755 [Rhodobacterales bacterium 52_120_T64]